MNVQPDLLLPHMEQLIQYMLVCNQDQHEDVALEAAEFWMAFMDAEVDPQMLKPILQQLVPVLLKNMVSERLGWRVGWVGGREARCDSKRWDWRGEGGAG